MSNTTMKSPNPWRASAKPAAPRKLGQLKKHESKWAYLFISPFFLMFLVFGLAPVIFSTYIAFFNWDPLGDTLFVGLDNFTYLAADSRFWQATGNTFAIWAFSTFPQMILALFLASILRNPKLRAPIFWRTLLLIPNITSVLAVAIVFGQLFGRDFGMFNVLIGFLGFPHVDFVSNGPAGYVAIATMITWRWVGYNSLIFLAAMLAIPNELYESAELDGATRWQQFRYVTLPGLRNTITFVIIVGTIGGLQVFAEPLTLAGNFNGGDSRQFSTLTLFLFEQMFVEQKYGYAAAIGIAITFIVLIISLINFLLTRRIASEGTK